MEQNKREQFIIRRIGGTTYKVKVVFNESGGETREDWLIFEDTHEAIVDRETWELAQKLRKTPKRIDTLGEANPLTGLLYCADCGSKMYNQRSRGTESKPYPYDVFECSTYKLAGQKRSAACCGHHISTKALRTLILDTIRTVSTFAISNQEAFVEKVRSASQLRQAEAAKDARRLGYSVRRGFP